MYKLAKESLLIILCIFITTMIACGPVHKTVRPTTADIDKIKTLALVVPEVPECTVICERAKATAGPAIMFGLLGAAIASSHNESQDREMAELIIPHLDKFSCCLFFINSLHNTLNSVGRFTEIKVFDKILEAEGVKEYDAVVVFDIKNWGLRIATRENEQMAAFVELEVKMVRTRDNKELWDEQEVVLGQGRHFFSNYQEDRELLRTELKQTFEDAGWRMANILIYQ